MPNIVTELLRIPCHRLLLTSFIALLMIPGCGSSQGGNNGENDPPVAISICDSAPNGIQCYCERYPESKDCICQLYPDSDQCYCLNPEHENTLRCLCVRDPNNSACPDKESKMLNCPATEDSNALIQSALHEASLGNWSIAKLNTDCALQKEPYNERAQKIKMQLDLDINYFDAIGLRDEHPFVVKPGQSLSIIARDCLKDPNLFIALAKFNDISVPKDLTYGTRIRIPGIKACQGNADEMHEQAIKLEKQEKTEQAWDLIKQAYEVDKREKIQETHDRLKTKWADLLVAQGLELFGTDCENARSKWKNALKVDANHEDAQYYLRDALCN